VFCRIVVVGNDPLFRVSQMTQSVVPLKSNVTVGPIRKANDLVLVVTSTGVRPREKCTVWIMNSRPAVDSSAMVNRKKLLWRLLNIIEYYD